MNDPCYDASTTNCQDAAKNSDSLVERCLDTKPTPQDNISDFEYNAWLTVRRCYKPSCIHLRFPSEGEYLNHVLTHISQPTVLIHRLDLGVLLKKNCLQSRNQETHSSSANHEPLRVRLKLKSKAGSLKRSFEVVPYKGRPQTDKGSDFENDWDSESSDSRVGSENRLRSLRSRPRRLQQYLGNDSSSSDEHQTLQLRTLRSNRDKQSGELHQVGTSCSNKLSSPLSTHEPLLNTEDADILEGDYIPTQLHRSGFCWKKVSTDIEDRSKHESDDDYIPPEERESEEEDETYLLSLLRKKEKNNRRERRRKRREERRLKKKHKQSVHSEQLNPPHKEHQHSSNGDCYNLTVKSELDHPLDTFVDHILSRMKKIKDEVVLESLKSKILNLITNAEGAIKNDTSEVIKNPKDLSNGRGFKAAGGLSIRVKTEFLGNEAPTSKGRSSERRPEGEDELDKHSIEEEEEEEEEQDLEEEEEDEDSTQESQADNEDQINRGDRQGKEDQGDTLQDEREAEDEGDSEENDLEDRSSMPPWGNSEEQDSACPAPPSAASSPTPSEVLRPHGYLAPEPTDEDSCYSRSPPGSPSRMVEMNGSASAVGGSDNDSGHSRSPAPFPGSSGSGGGSGGEEDSSGQFWDELVNNTSSQVTSASHSTVDNRVENGSPTAAAAGGVTVGDTSVTDVAMLDSDPLLLPESSTSTEGEQENLNLLQNLTGESLQTPDVDRGDTEYMSLDRLGEAAFCCDVCGERTQDRRVLEEHRAAAGHYKCSMSECSQLVWTSSGELLAHQSSAHGQQQNSPRQSTPPQRSPSGSAGTPPVQQLAQQVQRLPIPQQAGYPAITPAQYPVVAPQQQLSPQLPPQMGPQIPPQMVPQMAPHMPSQMGPNVARRPPIGYRMPIPGQPFGPGSPGQQQAAAYSQPASFSGTIQPRPLNTMVAAQQPVRGQMQPRMGPGMNAGGMVRGMGPVSMRGQKRLGVPLQGGRGMPPLAAKQQRRMEGAPLQQDGVPGKKSDAKAVANILATRGITVTPAGVTRPGAGAQQGNQGRQRQSMMAPAPPQPVPTLNLNSAISIIPTTAATNSRQQNNSGFAVPQGRSIQRQPQTTNVDRPPRPPTVDLTGDGPTPPPGSTRLQMGPTFHRGRGRPSNLSRTTCQICDKTFSSPEMLNQHMAMHRTPGKLPYRCNLCNAQYPTQQGLQQHRQTYHKEAVGMGPPLVSGEEMVIPLVDLKQPGVAARLGALGIHHCIPLSGLGNQSGGYFSLPVVSIDGSRSSAAGNLRSLGASGVLSIGPIKLVPR